MKSKKSFLLLLASTFLLTGCNFGDLSSMFNFGSLTNQNNNGLTKTLSMSLNKTEVSLNSKETFQLVVTMNNFTDNSVTYTSNNENAVTVSSTGLISVTSSAVIGQTYEIKVTSVQNASYSAKCLVTITKAPSDYTIMYYMSGSSLEYDEDGETASDRNVGLFSDDIKEMLSVNFNSKDINILIETGGTKHWCMPSSFLLEETSISATSLQRWVVTPVTRYKVNQTYYYNKLKLVSTLNTNQMASKASFQSFLEWGLTSYEATQMGVVLSGHGAGIGGCVVDDNYTYTLSGYSNVFSHSLDTGEVAIASSNALSKSNKSKFTWIGYDCCLMGCADIATINADSYEYMIASQETEYGYGWDHDSYLPSIVQNPSITPESLIPTITSSFLNQYHSNCYAYGTCYQTLCGYNLKNSDGLVTAFNDYISKVGTKQTSYNNVVTAFKAAKYNSFGEGYYGLGDFSTFLDKMIIQYPNISVTNIKTAINNMVVENSKQICSAYNNSLCGMSIFVPVATNTSGSYPLQISKSDYTGSNKTKFTNWQTMCLTYGGWVF